MGSHAGVAWGLAGVCMAMGTAALTGFSVMSVGDAAAQRFAGASSSEVDLQRNIVSAVYNGAASPVFYKWYRIMDWLIPGVAVPRLVVKTVVSQLVTTGANNPCYLLWKNAAEAWVSAIDWAAVRAGGGGERSRAQLQPPVDWAAVRAQTGAQLYRDLPNLYGSSMLFWLPVTGSTYMFVPDHLRVLWVSLASVLWGGYVSLVAHQPHDVRQK